MYEWRKLTAQQRTKVLENGKAGKKPWHSPPHYQSTETSYYMITAACFEHRSIIGLSPQRISLFESALVELVSDHCRELFAWVILPNHYHALVDTQDVILLLHSLGRLHGRTSFHWNGEDNKRGRQVWCNVSETAMKSESHFYASINYVLHNPVRHGYVDRWTDWPFSNANEYIDSVGRSRAEKTWQDYPLFDYGKDWDPPEL